MQLNPYESPRSPSEPDSAVRKAEDVEIEPIAWFIAAVSFTLAGLVSMLVVLASSPW